MKNKKTYLVWNRPSFHVRSVNIVLYVRSTIKNLPLPRRRRPHNISRSTPTRHYAHFWRSNCLVTMILIWRIQNNRDSEKAFSEWLKNKKKNKDNEKQSEEQRMSEVKNGYFVRTREECDKAFKQ